MALRLVRYGYPTSFFLRQRIGNRDVFVENDHFARRFFPPRMARRPIPTVLDSPKTKGAYRIFVLGESAAMGDPDPSFAFGRILEVLLRERFPGARFEVINLAFTAINSHVILPIARECAGHDGDLWIIYMGNNEVTGPFGPGTVFGGSSLNLNLIRASMTLKTFKTGQLLESLQHRLNARAEASNSWAGLQMFRENQIQQADPRMQRVYAHFERNLNDILQAGERAGAKILVSTVASNLKDCAPFASAHANKLNDTQKAAWEKSYGEGVALETGGQVQEAIRKYAAAAEIDPDFAELQFRLGRCYLAQGDLKSARQCLESARDLDTLRIRADSKLNAILAAAARRHESRGVRLVDASEALAHRGSDGIPGDELFYDHVHLTYEGNYALASILAEEAAKRLPKELTSRDAGSWMPPDLCAERLALTGWNRYQMYELMERRLSEAPFTNQSNQATRQQRYLEKLVALKPFLQPGALDQAAPIFRAALTNAPGDFHLHENYAKLLHARGDWEGAIAQTRQFAELLPHNPTPYYNLGFLFAARGRSDKAVKYYTEALWRRPDYAEAYNGLGQILARQGRTNEALGHFARALQLRPDYVDALLSAGEVWEKTGQPETARDYYLRALSAQPNSFAVRIHVGNILMATGQLFESTKHFGEAARLQPGNASSYFAHRVQDRPEDPLAHFQMANALAAQNKISEAMASLQEAIRFKPDFWEARYLLGVELALQNRLGEARTQFSEAIRLNPDFALAHLNLGVAFAKEMKLKEAREQFETTLRLDPTNKAAAHHLKTLQTIGRSP